MVALVGIGTPTFPPTLVFAVHEKKELTSGVTQVSGTFPRPWATCSCLSTLPLAPATRFSYLGEAAPPPSPPLFFLLFFLFINLVLHPAWRA